MLALSILVRVWPVAAAAQRRTPFYKIVGADQSPSLDRGRAGGGQLGGDAKPRDESDYQADEQKQERRDKRAEHHPDS